MERIKIFHILTSGLGKDGISSSQLVFFKNMDMERFEIIVAAVHNNDQDTINNFRQCGCTVIEFPDRKANVGRYFLSLLKVLKNIKPEIVHVHGSSAIMSIDLLAAVLAGVKIRIAHSRNTTADNLKIDKLFRPIFKCLYTDALACGSDAGEWLFGAKSFSVIHNGKDFERFSYDLKKREEQRRRYSLEDKVVVGHVGVFNNQKNHEFLIKVFYEFQKRNPNSVLYLIGNGNQLLRQREEQVKELGIRDKVIFAGGVNDVPERLQAMDIMVFPSFFEGLPNVVLEWQAEGLPSLISDRITQECVATDFVEFASIDESPEVWAKKMEELLNKYKDRKIQAVHGINALRENGFDIKDAVSQLESIYEALVSEHSKRNNL